MNAYQFIALKMFKLKMLFNFQNAARISHGTNTMFHSLAIIATITKLTTHWNYHRKTHYWILL